MYNKKPITLTIIAFTIFLLAILGISAYFLIEEAQKTATIKLTVAPVSAEISLNGISYKNLETHKIKPGDYDLTISKPDYFETWQESFSIAEGENKEIYLELTPLPQTNWYKSHPRDADSLDAIYDHRVYQKSERLISQYPLLTKLPLRVEYFKNNSTYVYYLITYRIDDNDNVAIIIQDYTGNNKKLAIERIEAEGFNPDDYAIEYQDKTSEITPTFTPE